MSQAKIRLFIDHPLGAGQGVPLNEAQAHYLFAVMRLGVGEPVLVFNGRDGEWQSEVTRVAKRGGDLRTLAQTRLLQPPPDLWLLFAPLKKARTAFIVEKATELGAARIVPVQTEFTNAESIRQDRLQAHAVEAAEQCGATFVPEVGDLVALDRLLTQWDGARRILWCDESLVGAPTALRVAPPDRGPGPARDPWAILIGPEGGFSAAERARLAALPHVTAAGLGPRILRADTAAVAALTLWQAMLGDWR